MLARFAFFLVPGRDFNSSVLLYYTMSLSGFWYPPTQPEPLTRLMNILTDHHSFLIGSQDPIIVPRML